MIKVGCCGFPASLDRYFQELKVVEVQLSFYRTLGERQVENWSRKAPEGFEFILKAPQCVTHSPNSPTYRRSHLPSEKRRDCGSFRLTPVVREEMETFLDRARFIGAERFLFQSPASFRPNSENLEQMAAFFQCYKGKGIFIWEPRGRDWTAEVVKGVCKRLDLIHATDPFLSGPQVWGDFTYFRMHGNLRTYRYTYTGEELMRLLELAKRGGYIMFNNSSMFKDALRMKQLLVG